MKIARFGLILNAGVLFLSGLSLLSFAEGIVDKKIFAKCFGDHHGSYLTFISSTQGGVVTGVEVKVTTDADESEVPAVTYKVVELLKDWQPLQPKAFSWVIRQAIKAETHEPFLGFIKIRATNAKGERMDLNLKKPVGSLKNAVSINGYIEELTCPSESIVD